MPRTLFALLGVLAVSLSALTGCSSSDNTQSADTTQVTTSTQDPDYREQYINLVAESNCIGRRASSLMGDLYGDDDEMTEAEWEAVREPLQAVFAEYASSVERFSAGLSQATWPTDYQPAIDNLITKLAGDAAYATSLSEANSFTEAESLPPPPDSDAAEVVRSVLGLNDTENDDLDYCDIAGIEI